MKIHIERREGEKKGYKEAGNVNIWIKVQRREEERLENRWSIQVWRRKQKRMKVCKNLPLGHGIVVDKMTRFVILEVLPLLQIVLFVWKVLVWFGAESIKCFLISCLLDKKQRMTVTDFLNVFWNESKSIRQMQCFLRNEAECWRRCWRRRWKERTVFSHEMRFSSPFYFLLIVCTRSGVDVHYWINGWEERDEREKGKLIRWVEFVRICERMRKKWESGSRRDEEREGWFFTSLFSYPRARTGSGKRMER